MPGLCGFERSGPLLRRRETEPKDPVSPQLAQSGATGCDPGTRDAQRADMVTALRAVPGDSLQLDGADFPVAVRRGLLERGVLLEALPGECAAIRAERLDTALMAMFRDTRDAECFETLYARTSDAVFNWLRRLSAQQRCGLDLLEVLQDTFVNVYQYCTRFRDERENSFRVWVRTIAANALRRARSQVPRRAERAEFERLCEPVALRCEPARRLDDLEERQRLAITWMLFLQHYAQAYAGLSTRDRAALELVEIERLSYAQAGARLSVGSSNMKMIMFRARQRLIARMNRSMGLEEPAGRETVSTRRELRAVG